MVGQPWVSSDNSSKKVEGVMATARTYPFGFAAEGKSFVLERIQGEIWAWPPEPTRYTVACRAPSFRSLGEVPRGEVRSVRRLIKWSLKRLRAVQAKERRRRLAEQLREKKLSGFPREPTYSKSELAFVQRWHRINRCSACGGRLGKAQRATHSEGTIRVAFECLACARRERTTFNAAGLTRGEEVLLERHGISWDPPDRPLQRTALPRSR